MSLMMLAIEYLLLHTIFETIRQKDEDDASKERISSMIMADWKPLSDIELNNIRNLIGN